MDAHEKSRELTSFAQSQGVPGEAQHPLPNIKIGKAVVPRGGEGVVAEVFTMTLGSETIQLLPLKNWVQLDAFKWKARGILPRTPAGLEITADHVKVAGETVSPWDPEACGKLEKAFNEWLALERQTVELATEKAKTSEPQKPSEPDEQVVTFHVEMDDNGKARLRCQEGDETVKVVALNLQGLNAFIQEGLMRKPQSLKVGALHDWVELDGQLFRLQKDNTGGGELERVLNERYVWAPESGAPQDVAVFPNPASPTGFDIQFPATPHGLVENRKRHLNEETLEMMSDPEKCRVLRKGMIAKLTPPELIFKRKTPGGGESYLDAGPNSTLSIVTEEGQKKTIELSKPVNLLELNARELTAVFNHPAVNRRARLAEAGGSQPVQRAA